MPSRCIYARRWEPVALTGRTGMFDRFSYYVRGICEGCADQSAAWGLSALICAEITP